MYKPIRVFDLNHASAVTVNTNYVDFGREGYYDISLYIPTMTSSTDVYLNGSHDGTTFSKTYFTIASGVAAPGRITFDSAATLGWFPVPDFHFRYVKTEYSTAMTATSAIFKFCIS